MTDEERKAWKEYVAHVKIMAGNPVLLEEMSFIKPVIAADAELKRFRTKLDREKLVAWTARHNMIEGADAWADSIIAYFAEDAFLEKIQAPCPSCASFLAKLDREKLAKIIYFSFTKMKDGKVAPQDYDCADAIIAYFKEGV